MEEISTLELLHLLGGAQANPPCVDELQKEAGKHMDDPTFNWDDWSDRYEDCVFGNLN